eukprot:5481070-Pyramimonas_sp.AAC.1
MMTQESSRDLAMRFRDALPVHLSRGLVPGLIRNSKSHLADDIRSTAPRVGALNPRWPSGHGWRA